MQKTNVIAGLAGGLSAAAFLLATPAVAEPVVGDNAADAVAELKGGGNRVYVENLSDAPLAEAQVVAITPGPDIRETIGVQDPYANNENRQDVPVGQVYYLTVE